MERQRTFINLGSFLKLNSNINSLMKNCLQTCQDFQRKLCTKEKEFHDNNYVLTRLLRRRSCFRRRRWMKLSPDYDPQADNLMNSKLKPTSFVPSGEEELSTLIPYNLLFLPISKGLISAIVKHFRKLFVQKDHIRGKSCTESE